jgi:hypothetical protein
MLRREHRPPSAAARAAAEEKMAWAQKVAEALTSAAVAEAHDGEPLLEQRTATAIRVFSELRRNPFGDKFGGAVAVIAVMTVDAATSNSTQRPGPVQTRWWWPWARR